tara:strand:- start:2375 stop:2626 length:252 start_codon:yes stop_codon:yes gene_type:complete
MNSIGEEIDSRLEKILKEIFQIDEVNLENSMDDIPEWDSFRHILLLTKIEKEFGIRIEMSDFTIMTSIPIIKSKILMYLNEKQ